jgi:hypothetical protein
MATPLDCTVAEVWMTQRRFSAVTAISGASSLSAEMRADDDVK